jgi:hypothetical protein
MAMTSFTVKTGFGYFVDAENNIVAKCELQPGEHPLKKGYQYVEVESKEALETVKVSALPLSEAEIREQKIQAEIRKMAEERLIARGEL